MGSGAPPPSSPRGAPLPGSLERGVEGGEEGLDLGVGEEEPGPAHVLRGVHYGRPGDDEAVDVGQDVRRELEAVLEGLHEVSKLDVGAALVVDEEGPVAGHVHVGRGPWVAHQEGEDVVALANLVYLGLVAKGGLKGVCLGGRAHADDAGNAAPAVEGGAQPGVEEPVAKDHGC